MNAPSPPLPVPSVLPGGTEGYCGLLQQPGGADGIRLAGPDSLAGGECWRGPRGRGRDAPCFCHSLLDGQWGTSVNAAIFAWVELDLLFETCRGELGLIGWASGPPFSPPTSATAAWAQQAHIPTYLASTYVCPHASPPHSAPHTPAQLATATAWSPVQFEEEEEAGLVPVTLLPMPLRAGAVPTVILAGGLEKGLRGNV